MLGQMTCSKEPWQVADACRCANSNHRHCMTRFRWLLLVASACESVLVKMSVSRASMALLADPHLDDEGDVRVVDAARRDVRGEHDAALGGAELVGSARALRLALARVHLQHGHTQRVEQRAVELRDARRRKEAHDLELALGGHVLPDHRQQRRVLRGHAGDEVLLLYLHTSDLLEVDLALLSLVGMSRSGIVQPALAQSQ